MPGIVILETAVIEQLIKDNDAAVYDPCIGYECVQYKCWRSRCLSRCSSATGCPGYYTAFQTTVVDARTLLKTQASPSIRGADAYV